MAGSKGAPRASSKSEASDKQQSLLRYYRKSNFTKDGQKATESSGLGIDSLEHSNTLDSCQEQKATPSSLAVEIERKQRRRTSQTSLRAADDSDTTQECLPPEREVRARPRESAKTADISRQPHPDGESHAPYNSPLMEGSATPHERAEIIGSQTPSRVLTEVLPVNQGHSNEIHDIIDLVEDSNHDESDSTLHTVHLDASPIVTASCNNRHTPIFVDSSPPPEVEKSSGIHPFFASRAATKRREKKNDILVPYITTSQQRHAPWPDAETQHTKGRQSSFGPHVPSLYPSRRKSSPTISFSPQPSRNFLKDHSDSSLAIQASLCPQDHPFVYVPSHERENIALSIPEAHQNHAVISRLLHVNSEVHRTVYSGEVWARKWAPRRTADVLGNEGNIYYMKEWLQALEVHTENEDSNTGGKPGPKGTKRPVVMRQVEKNRRRKRRRVDSDDESELESWITEGEEDEDAEKNYDSEDDSLHGCLLPPDRRVYSPLKARHEEQREISSNLQDAGYPANFSRLTNTILLTGPSGSGKTSAVYACAEELGWEVFEVYPGTGKRSGSNITSLIGEVGKNHLVGRREVSGSGSKNVPVQSFINSGFGFLAERHESEIRREGVDHKVRQSAILLEEVDILFKEDASFWPTVVNIIKSSHRPIFMTCNDVSLVPREDLPLQTTLEFQPCPAPLAVSFLQSVCLAEGVVVPRQQLDEMYAATYELIEPDQPDEPQIPFPSQPLTCPDLRRVLNELQFWCQGAKADSVPQRTDNRRSSTEALVDWGVSLKQQEREVLEELQGGDIVRLWTHCDYVSFVDGYLERRPSDALEALAIDRYFPSIDDEVGHTLLMKPRLEEFTTSLSFYNREEVIAKEMLMRSRHVFETSGTGPRVRSCLLGIERGATLDSRSLVRGRAANQTQVVSYLDDVIPLSAPLLPRAPAVTEYAAYLRQMVLADDMDDMTETGRRGRRARSWRYLFLSAEGLEGARNTGF